MRLERHFTSCETSKKITWEDLSTFRVAGSLSRFVPYDHSMIVSEHESTWAVYVDHFWLDGRSQMQQ